MNRILYVDDSLNILVDVAAGYEACTKRVWGAVVD